MKIKTIGIFGKVFFYTILILVLVISITALFFTRQISDVLKISQREQLTRVFNSLQRQLEDKSNDEAKDIAKAFHDKNSFFNFCLRAKNGNILYSTPNYVEDRTDSGFLVSGIKTIGSLPLEDNIMLEGIASYNNYRMIMTSKNGFIIQIMMDPSGSSIYNIFAQKTVLAALLLLLLGVLCAFLFARSITKPVKVLAQDTSKMSNLEPVSPPVWRGDEIGNMANDVYHMYGELKNTIKKLKNEIQKEKEMEQDQRNFFTAASHELKTPIAATYALLEGMTENVITPEEYPETLKECMKMMNDQAKLISEILEIVHLDGEGMIFKKEKINLKASIESILPAYRTLAEVKDLTIICDIKKDIYCDLDEKLFRRVISNILMNAVQNTPDGCEIRIECREDKYNIKHLSILNEGTHIQEDLLLKIFEPFYRQDKARSRNQGRSGLGLAIVKKALLQMNVEFSLKNTEEGVVFLLCL